MARPSLWNYEYTAYWKETNPWVFVTPTHFSKQTQVDLGYQAAYQDIEEIDNSFFQWKLIKDKVTTWGSFSGYANSEDTGHALSMALWTPTTSTVTAWVYSHVYNLWDKACSTYTVEVSKGGYVERVSWVSLDTLTIANDNAAIKLDWSAKGQYCFSSAILSANVTAWTWVTFTVDSTLGLLTWDVLISKADSEEITITVVDWTTFTANLVWNKTAWDVFNLKKKTASFTAWLETLKWYGKAEIKFANTLGWLSSATPTPITSISTEIQNNIVENHGSSSYHSYDNTQGLRKGSGKISLTMAKWTDLQLKYLKDEYQYVSFKTEWNKIGSTAHYETLTFVAKIKFTSSPVSISSWEIIVLNMDFKIVDEGSFTLKNAVASY